jgi:hypothetical protein
MGRCMAAKAAMVLDPLSTYTWVAPANWSGISIVRLGPPVRRVGSAGYTVGGVAVPSATGAVESVG